jgi:predicted dehydrogenase
MTASSPPLRVAVLGARQRRQGVGQHLARHVRAAGGQVVAVLGTRAATARAAAEALRDAADGAPAPYIDLQRLLQAERPDVLVIATPPAAHRSALDAALEAGCHALVEKPVLLGRGAAAQAEALGDAFVARRRHLVVHAQWPFVLPAWRRLHRDVDPQQAQHLRVELAPRRGGGAMLEDALPHALALAHALAPSSDAVIGQPEALWRDRDHVQVTFTYATPERRLRVEVVLGRVPEPPRPAALAIDGHEARRRITEPGYRLSLVDATGRAVGLPDPSAALVGWFLDRVRDGAPPKVDPAIRPGMSCLMALLDALGPGAPPPSPPSPAPPSTGSETAT